LSLFSLLLEELLCFFPLEDFLATLAVLLPELVFSLLGVKTLAKIIPKINKTTVVINGFLIASLLLVFLFLNHVETVQQRAITNAISIIPVTNSISFPPGKNLYQLLESSVIGLYP